LQNAELNIDSSPNIVWIVKSRRTRLVERVEYIVDARCSYILFIVGIRNTTRALNFETGT
jgi:hypothetical protein